MPNVIYYMINALQKFLYKKVKYPRFCILLPTRRNFDVIIENSEKSRKESIPY